MEGMFYRATSFNQPLSFDTSSVTSMSYMFDGATSFNQPLSFDTSSVTDMSYMFYGARSFNQPLRFDTSSVTYMDGIFSHIPSLSVCTRAVLHGIFSISGAWPYSWAGFHCPPPPLLPSSLPLPESPLPLSPPPISAPFFPTCRPPPPPLLPNLTPDVEVRLPDVLKGVPATFLLGGVVQDGVLFAFLPAGNWSCAGAVSSIIRGHSGGFVKNGTAN
eukprot:CAMPEP_0113291934 /NCGR_PEP_ID=MMETSP0008_2-20120614/34342_1 /TAXON_ID=97485 /ORGANISM="Prymnesium parvum" /LENGTH=216 /DNA_ID=CAMNT_0000143937 /DNA_START=280 /DNA_END=927 /DNA_ORIENTATION=- /assembly_acc=CAM_ASM_000153